MTQVAEALPVLDEELLRMHCAVRVDTVTHKPFDRHLPMQGTADGRINRIKQSLLLSKRITKT